MEAYRNETVHVAADTSDMVLMTSILRDALVYDDFECFNPEECKRQAQAPTGGSRHAQTIRLYHTLTKTVRAEAPSFTATVSEITILIYALQREIEYHKGACPWEDAEKPVVGSRHAQTVRICNELIKAL